MNDDRIGSYAQTIDKAVRQDPQMLMIVLATKQEEK